MIVLKMRKSRSRVEDTVGEKKKAFNSKELNA